MSLKESKLTETNIYELEVEVSAEEFEAAVEKAYQKSKNKFNVQGFRPGRAPRKRIELAYGEGVFYEDALDIVYPEAVGAALDAFGKKTVAAPYDVDIKEIGKDGVQMTMKVVVKPEVEIGEYKGLEVKKAEVEVTDEEIEEQLKSMQERNSRMIPVEGRAVKDGDIACIDFEGFVDGEAFEGGKGEEFDLTIGSGQFIPGFEEQIIGHNAEDEFDVNVTFPEDYAEELAGKEAVFKVKVLSIKEKELPELDDEFAKDVSEFDTMDEVRADTKETIVKQKEQQIENDFENEIIDKLIEGLKADIPEVMIEKRIDQNVQEFDQRLQMQGLNLQTYMQYTNGDLESFRKTFQEQSERQVKIRLVLEKIVELEGITVSEEEIEAEMQKYADAYQVDVKVIKASIPTEEVTEDLAVQKAIDLVKESVK